VSGTKAGCDCELTLTLDLNRPTGQRLGTFSVYRRCNGSPLFVDINLLISGFNIALAGALDSAISQRHGPLEEGFSGQSASAGALTDVAN
jgi:hypothetical protein